jgi:uncharacterized protein with LGFP repeats
LAGGDHVVAEFTGHAYVLTDRDPDELFALGIDAFGGATQPEFLRWLAGVAGSICSHDVVLFARGRRSEVATTGRKQLQLRNDLDDHPRVQRARAHRGDVYVYGDERGFVTLGRGVVNRLEVSVELIDAAANEGAGRGLISDAISLVAKDELVWAQVAPGNAASLRAFLSCGFTVVGAETLIVPAHPPDLSLA